jgi:hypothetical protein
MRCEQIPGPKEMLKDEIKAYTRMPQVSKLVQKPFKKASLRTVLVLNIPLMLVQFFTGLKAI